MGFYGFGIQTGAQALDGDPALCGFIDKFRQGSDPDAVLVRDHAGNSVDNLPFVLVPDNDPAVRHPFGATGKSGDQIRRQCPAPPEYDIALIDHEGVADSPECAIYRRKVNGSVTGLHGSAPHQTSQKKQGQV